MKRLWVGYLIAASVAVGGAFLAPAPLREVLLLIVGASGATALSVGPRIHKVKARSWDLAAAGVWLWLIGSMMLEFDLGPPPVGVGAQLAVYPLAAASILQLAKAGANTRRVATETLDVVMLTFAASAASCIFLVGPVLAGWQGTWSQVLAIGVPVGNILVFGALVRLVQTRHGGRWPMWFGTAGVFATSVAYSFVNKAGDHIPIDPPWMATVALAGAFALHPNGIGLVVGTHARNLQGQMTHHLDLVPVALALFSGPVLFLLVPESARHSVVVPLALSAIVMVAFSTSRMLIMIREADSQALTDELTGLPNRRALYRRYGARDLSETPIALLLIDLDRFKDVNDSLGHDHGDQLLVLVGERLRHRLRPRDLVVRLGGDEFAVVLPDVGVAVAEETAKRLLAAFDAPFPLASMTVHCEASIGIAVSPQHGTDLVTALRKADIAMYQAKTLRRTQVYGAHTDELAERLLISEELRGALGDPTQILVHYQPLVDLRTKAVIGVEALVRWWHPGRGMLAPVEFIPQAERAGLMPRLTYVVLGQALDQVSAWKAAGRDLRVSVNLAASDAVDIGLPAQVLRLLAERSLPPSVLRLEITEGRLMVDLERARMVLNTLRNIGVGVALDDFGTGYSGLSYLRELPIDDVKLDRSFMASLVDDSRGTAMVAAVVTLAHALGLTVVAEGVEEETVMDILEEIGCDEVQGFHVAPPMSADDLDEWFKRRDEQSQS